MQVIKKTKKYVTIKLSKDELCSIIDTCDYNDSWIEFMSVDLFDQLKDAWI
jgi:hypothetical protein